MDTRREAQFLLGSCTEAQFLLGSCTCETKVPLHLGSLFVLLALAILAKTGQGSIFGPFCAFLYYHKLVESIILSIISMLSSPNDESPANVAAALQGTEDSAYIYLLRLFAYGTWRDYKGISALLPKLLPHQILKLKQLTVLTLFETNKTHLKKNSVVKIDTIGLKKKATMVFELRFDGGTEAAARERLQIHKYSGIKKQRLNQNKKEKQSEHGLRR
ncbi:hypothetical protein OIU78_007604 [Salix suchowensis]|nr:hypothetical protein OIU78_007604 [Salix suchowensis]